MTSGELIVVVLTGRGQPLVTISVHEGANLREHWTGTVLSTDAPTIGEHDATAATSPVTGMKSHIRFHGVDVIGTPFRY